MVSPGPSRLRSIRTRIVVGYVVLAAIALVITVVIARGALIARFDNDIDQRLASEVQQLELVAEAGDPQTGEPFTDAALLLETHLQQVLPGDDAAFFALVDGDPFRLSFGAPADLFANAELVERWGTITESKFETADSSAGRARSLAVPVVLDDNRGTFVATVFTDNGRSDLDDVFRTLVLVGVVTLLASALIALSLAARVVRPVRDLTTLARSVTDADLSARIPVEGDDEIAELSATFNDMMSRLEDGFTSQRDFLDDVAHELRTPITIIRGHLEVLDDDPVERAATVAVLHDELDRMNRYVDDLLVLAQAERPDFLRVTDVDLDLLATTLLGKASALADRTWVLDDAAVGVATLDEQRVTQAVLNLAHNAVRHTSDGDEIGIGIRTDDTRLTIRVRDTGTGVDPAVVDDLFDRHIRSARKPDHRRVRSRSLDRRRDRCRTQWQRCCRHPPRIRGYVRHFNSRPARGLATRNNVTRILIAEDEDRIVSFLEKGLQSNGYTTIAVRTGTDAIALARDESFDLLILDLGLPGADGHEVLREIRGRGERLPVIVLTARSGLNDTVGVLDGGADDHVAKPFRFEELLARIRLRLRDDSASGIDDPGAATLSVGSLSLDLRTRRVTASHGEVDLTAREFTLLETFMRNPDRVLSRMELLSSAWGYDFDPNSNVVDVYVRYLRNKVGANAIETVRGAGYRLRA